MKSEPPESDPVQIPKRRLLCGVCIYIVGQLSPLCIPLITSSSLSVSLKATISPLLFFGLPSLFTLAAIAVLGRDGFNYLKARLFAFIKRKVRLGPVSKTRYYIGLVLFILPFLLAWIAPYVSPLTPIIHENEIAIALAGDTVLLVSLLVLGGDFWEKLRSLFIYKPQPAPGTLSS